MAELFSLVWLASLVSTIFFGVEFVRKKSNKSNLNLTDKQCKTILLASIITFVISFIVVGATAPSIEQTPEYNTLYENNIAENITQEITISFIRSSC